MSDTPRAPSFSAVVTDVRLQHTSGTRQVWQMSLDRTLFKPGATGTLLAETRTGTRLEIAVFEVLCDEQGVIWHVVEKPLAAGTDVCGQVQAPASPRQSVPD